VLTGWTWQWYPGGMARLSLRRAVSASLVVSFWSALISIVMGTLLGYAIVRHPNPNVRRFLAASTYMC